MGTEETGEALVLDIAVKVKPYTGRRPFIGDEYLLCP
jgi:hypothetical protein